MELIQNFVICDRKFQTNFKEGVRLEESNIYIYIYVINIKEKEANSSGWASP